MAFALSHPNWTYGMAALEAGGVPLPCCWLSQVGLGGCKWPAGPPWLQGNGQHRPLAVFLINPPLRTGEGKRVLQSQGILCCYSSTFWDSLVSTALLRTSQWECFLLHSTQMHGENVEGNSLSSSKSGPKITAGVWVTLWDSPILAWMTVVVFHFFAFLATPLIPPSREGDQVHSPHWAESSQTEFKAVEICAILRTGNEAWRIASVERCYVATTCACKFCMPTLRR